MSPASSPFTYLITGASRSLGLAYAKALLAAQPANRVVAAARNPDSAEELQALKKAEPERVYLLKLDLASQESVDAAVKELEGSEFLNDAALDALVANAGVAEGDEIPASQLTPDVLEANMSTNLYGTVRVNTAFLPLLRKGQGKQLFSVSSVCGSIAQWGESPSSRVAYAASKAALNMYSKKLATELKSEGFTVVMFHPGYVIGPINQGKGQLTMEEAAKLALENVFQAVSPADNGRFLQYDGEPMEW
ncbi:hypothetical protein JCM6882_007425 [Rhodosporidiobolus microsporus]